MLLGSTPLGAIPVGAAPGSSSTPVYLTGIAVTVGPGRAKLIGRVSIKGEALIVGSAKTVIKTKISSISGRALLDPIARARITPRMAVGGISLLTPQAHGKVLLRFPLYTGGRAFLTTVAGGSLVLIGATLPIFPVLLPLAWPVHKKPILASRATTGATGRETQLAAAAFPRWAFTLTYGGGSSWLRDQTQNIVPDSTKLGLTEFEQLSALFIYCKGSFGEFYYEDPDDNSRSKAPIAVGDGTTTSFPIYVPWGFGPFSPSFFYPVGGINTIDAVYIDGVVQSTSTYTLDTTRTQLIFNSPLVKDTIITADFHFYFRCRFLDDHLDFNQWGQNMWECAEVRFESVKP